MYKQLIADSGSTKTDWAILHEDGQINFFVSEGLNPLFRSSQEVCEILQRDALPFVDVEKVHAVYFYGAGCGTPERSAEISRGINDFFTQASVTVQTDLLGAAHASCGKESGIVGILGTGSSSCFYDGEKIAEQVPSLGYILGDEGSGNHIGKLLLQAYLQNELPVDLKQLFEKQYPYSFSDFLDHVYRKPQANRFLASFAPFVIQNRNHPFIESQIIEPVLHTFFQSQICKYSNYQQASIHLVGSIAFYLKEKITQIARQYNCMIGKIIQSPIEHLAYYRKNSR